MSEQLATLLSLDHNARSFSSLDELAFYIAHNTREIVAYKTAAVWSSFKLRPSKILSISEISQVNQDSQFSHNIKNVIKDAQQLKKSSLEDIWYLNKSDFKSDAVKSNWVDGFTDHLVIFVFRDFDGVVNGGVILSVDNANLDDNDKQRIDWLMKTFNYHWQSISNRTQAQRFNFRWKKSYKWWILASLIFISFIPVSQGVIAPAKIVAQDPIVITAPMDGVIESVAVKPNEKVDQHSSLIVMDERDLKVHYELAKKELSTIDAKYEKAVTTGFNDIKNRADINVLKAEMQEKKLEVDYTKKLLKEAVIKSPINGMAIIDDVNEWVGKPVVTGEKIMQVAKPNQVEMEIFLPVDDAIDFKVGDKVDLFLNSQPLNKVKGTIRFVSFAAKLSPHQVLSYRILADVNKGQTLPQVGNQGSAKLFGKSVFLIYYVLRRPLTVLRQFTGV